MLAGLILLSPAIAIPVVAIAAVVAVRARRHDQPIATEVTNLAQRWYLWLAAGAALFGIGLATLALAGEDASTAAWATWVLSWLFAGLAAAFGLALSVAKLAGRRAQPQP